MPWVLVVPLHPLEPSLLLALPPLPLEALPRQPLLGLGPSRMAKYMLDWLLVKPPLAPVRLKLPALLKPPLSAVRLKLPAIPHLLLSAMRTLRQDLSPWPRRHSYYSFCVDVPQASPTRQCLERGRKAPRAKIFCKTSP